MWAVLAALCIVASPAWAAQVAKVQRFGNATGSLVNADAVDPLSEWFSRYKEGPKIWKWHHYFGIYHRHLQRHRAGGQPVNMLVVGVQSGGEIGMWQEYFKETGLNFIGVDVNPLCKDLEKKYDRTKIIIGDQADLGFLTSQVVPALPERLDIVIDDGGHGMNMQINTFNTLYPRLHSQGTYLTEDTGTSYSPPDSFFRQGSATTFMEMMKGKVDLLNGYATGSADGFTSSTDSLSFYDSVVVVEKSPHPPPTQERRGTYEIPYCHPSQPNYERCRLDAEYVEALRRTGQINFLKSSPIAMPTETPPAKATGSQHWLDALKAIAELEKTGHLTPDEFRRAKAKILLTNGI